VVYLHIFRGFFYYGSYKAPREMVWLLGVVIFLLMMATAFMGYVLPWGQMSFWGAKVITGLFGAIPLVGEPIQTWLLGGFAPDNAALNRFFSLHYLLPFVIAAWSSCTYLGAAHSGFVNPTGVEVKSERIPCRSTPITPRRTASDARASSCSCSRSRSVLRAEHAGHPDNYIPANPLSTPAHIVPEWYFWPFYAILRAFTVDFLFIPAKLMGVLAMFGSILLLVLPALAGYLAGAFGPLPPAVPQVLLDLA
jgi:ubiquinol-cytochrome c reductase cytochrome b subunit